LTPKTRDIVRALEREGARGLEVVKLLIVVEQTATGFSAYSPDLPGCIATGGTREEVERTMQEAVAFHLDGMRADGLAVPPPHTYATYVEVAA
jgi:predicted RNase H-like HicB family nuclease